MADQNRASMVIELYQMGQLPEKYTTALKEMEGMGQLEAGAAALADNPNFLQSLGAAEEQPLTSVQRTIQAARPYLQGIGATAGGVLGAASGLLTGPGAPAASPAGAVIGGGLGYAIGDEVADILENWSGLKEPEPLVAQLSEAGKNIAMGAAYEMGGQAIGPALGAAGRQAMKVPAIEYGIISARELIGKAPAMTEKAVKQLAGKFLVANTSKGPMIAKNIEDARALEEAIPGLEFTYAEMTGDPALIKLQRATEREPGQFAQNIIERRNKNDKAIRDFLRSKRPEGEIEDVLEVFGGAKKEAETGVETARQALEAETERLAMGPGTIEAGQVIRAEAEAGKAAAKRAGKKLYKEVPEFEIDAEPLLDTLDAIEQPMSRIENVQENVPWGPVNRIRAVLESTDNIVTPKDLDGIQSEIKAEIRKLSSGAGEINERKLSRLRQLNSSIDSLLQQASSAEEPAAQALAKARTFWKTEVIDKFKRGDVGEILATRGGEYRVKDSQIASKFFKPGAAGQESARSFLKSVGTSPKAMTAIEDAAKQDLLTKFPQGEITENGLRAWLNKNKLALKELNLTSKFDDVKKARQQLSDAITFANEFNRSEASKLIGSDVGKSIQTALNSANKGKAAMELMKRTGGNKRAQAGLRNALNDFMIEQAENQATGMVTKLDTLDKLTKQYQPAINVFYNGDKAALTAWNQARKAFRTAARSMKSPLMSTQSDTAENIATMIFKTLGVSSGRTGTLVRAFLQPLKNQEQTKVKALLNYALLNPDFAYTLRLAAETAEPTIKGKLPKAAMAGRGKFADILRAMPKSVRQQFLAGQGEYVRTGVLPAYLQRRISQQAATMALIAQQGEEQQ